MTSGPAPCVAAIDVGGTTVKGALIHPSGRILERHTSATGADLGGDHVLRVVVEMAERLVLPRRERDRAVPAVGIVSPGIVDPAAGTVSNAANLGWPRVALRDVVAGSVGVPVAIGHDVRSAARAEWELGPSVRHEDFAFIALGTGVAAAVVSGGALVDGAINAAGELGHLVVVPGGEPCACGQRGCLEVYMSGAGLSRRYGASGAVGPLAAEDIVARLATDPDAARVWEDGVAALAAGVAALVTLVDPGRITIGGGVGLATGLVPQLRDRLAGWFTWRSAPEVEQAALGTSAGLLGAALLATEEAGLPFALARPRA